MIKPENIRVQITLPKSLIAICKKHHIRVSKIAREVTEEALNKIVERYKH